MAWGFPWLLIRRSDRLISVTANPETIPTVFILTSGSCSEPSSRAGRILVNNIDLSPTFNCQSGTRWNQLRANDIRARYLCKIRRGIKLIDSFRDERICKRITSGQVNGLNHKLELSPRINLAQSCLRLQLKSFLDTMILFHKFKYRERLA